MGAKQSSRSLARRRTGDERIPGCFKSLFWDYAFDALATLRDKDTIIGRILERGDWDAYLWLRDTYGRTGLRAWIVEHRGRGLDKRRRNFLATILGIPMGMVAKWEVEMSEEPWSKRLDAP